MKQERPILNRLALHSCQLKFTGPDHKEYKFESPIPKDLKATLQQLSKNKKKVISDYFISHPSKRHITHTNPVYQDLW